MATPKTVARKIKKFFVFHGGHMDRENGMCAMEWAAFLADRPHTASPVCVADDITSLMIEVNDHTDDKLRQRLHPFIPRSLRTSATKELGNIVISAPTKTDQKNEQKRSVKRVDWFYRTLLPIFLAATNYQKQADELQALPALRTCNSTRKIDQIIKSLCLDELTASVTICGELILGVVGENQLYWSEIFAETLTPLSDKMNKTVSKRVEKEVQESVFIFLDELLPPLNAELAKNELIQQFLAA